MSTKDFIKKSVLNTFTQYDAPKLALALLTALALGILIYLVYRQFYTGVVYSRSFAVTLVGMCVLTCMVTLAISTNVVISLGMVGALSIVRFRTAVKDPLDLLYLFWSITTGITAGARYVRIGPCNSRCHDRDDPLFLPLAGQRQSVHCCHSLSWYRRRRRYRSCLWPLQICGKVQDHAQG